MNIIPEPLTTHLAKNKIKNLMEESKFLLEYGSGGSTLYASKFCEKIMSVETDWKFYKFLQKMKPNNTQLLFVNVGKTKLYGVGKKHETFLFENNLCEEYSSSPWKLMKQKNPDLVFIDGRYRVASLLYSLINNENEKCQYIFDDYKNRPFYHIIDKYINLIDVCENTIFFEKKQNIDLKEIQYLIKIYNNDFR